MAVTIPQQASSSLRLDFRTDEMRSERSALSGKMMRFVLLHFVSLDASALQKYTFERQETDYPDAEAGLDIFDGAGKLVFQGKEFHSGIAGYWRPASVSSGPERTSSKKDWGHSSRTSSSRVN